MVIGMGKDLLGALGYILLALTFIGVVVFWRYVLAAGVVAVVVWGAYLFLNLGAKSRRKA